MEQAMYLIVLIAFTWLSIKANVDTQNYVKDRTQMIPGRVDDLETYVNSNADTLLELEEKLAEYNQLSKDRCLTTEKMIHQNLKDQSESQDPPEIQQLELTDAAQDSSNTAVDNADRAIDGNTNNNVHSCTHSYTYTTKHWWQARLTIPARLTRVTVYNRGDCCGDRLSNFRIEGFEDDPQTNHDQTPQLCATYPSSVATGGSEAIECDSPTRARYMRITQNDAVIALTLCEVIVEGFQFIDALQSSNRVSEDVHGAWRAMDSSQDSCSHTDFEADTDPWWQLNMLGTKTVTGIKITNRNDEKYVWLRDFEVSVYEKYPTNCEEVKHSVCAYQEEVVAQGQVVTFPCDPPVTGEFVKITKKQRPEEALSLCEVVVLTQ